MILNSEFNTDWVRKFALFPVYTDDAFRRVWLQYYWKKYIKGSQICSRCKLTDDPFVSGHWVTSSTEPNRENSNEDHE